MNRRAHEPDLDRSRHSRPFELQCDGSAGFPTERLGGFFARPALGWLAHDLDYPVPGLQSRALGGSTGHWRHYDEPAVANVRLEPQPSVVAGGGLAEPGKTVRRKECRVGISQ